MCGIFGWSFKKRSRVEIGKREAMAAVLAIANSLRGDKSWGIYTYSKQGASVRKQVGDISEVPDISSYGRFPIVMGHTRQPTQGAVTQKNAHPFRVNNIVLAHNGVVYNSDDLDKKYNRKVAVDSQHFAFHLSDKKPFDDIEAYGAIEWVDMETPDRVYICRLHGGSLSVYGVRNFSGETVGVAWSSDSDHLRSALGAARMQTAFPYKSLDEGHIHYIENGALYECPADVPKLKVKEHSFRSSSSYYGDYSGYYTDHERGFWVRDAAGEWSWIKKTSPTSSLYYGNDWPKSPHTRTRFSVSAVGQGGVCITEKDDEGKDKLKITRYDPQLDDEDAATVHYFRGGDVE